MVNLDGFGVLVQMTRITIALISLIMLEPSIQIDATQNL